VRNISIMPDILRPIWENFKTTSIYGRGSEFLTVYQERSSKDNSTKDDLEQMYVDFTNDVMRFYHTGLWRNESLDDVHVSLDAVPGQPVPVSSYTTRFGELRYDATLEEMRALPDQVWAAAGANGVMRAADDTLNIAVAGERAASPTAQTAYQRASPDARALWDEMTRRIGLEYWPTVQAFSGMSNAVKNKNGSMVLGILTGRMKYSVSRGKFLTRTQFLSEAKARDYFAANAFPWARSAAAVVSRMHTDTQARRQLARARGESPVYRHRDEADFSANDILFEMMDRMVAHSENVWDWTAGMIGLKRPKVQSVTLPEHCALPQLHHHSRQPVAFVEPYDGRLHVHRRNEHVRRRLLCHRHARVRDDAADASQRRQRHWRPGVVRFRLRRVDDRRRLCQCRGIPAPARQPHTKQFVLRDGDLRPVLDLRRCVRDDRVSGI